MATATAKKTTVKPIDDRVLVRPTKADTKTASGIILPESATEKPQTGKVIAVGPGKLNDDGSRSAPSVKVGDTVLYGKYSGTEIQLNDEEHMIMRESELLGVIEK